MAEILGFTDIHINAHKGKAQRLTDCLNVLRWVFDTARQRKIKKVIFLGDLFQHRQKIDTLAYFNTFQIFQEYSDVFVYILLGNHDLWFHDQWDVNSIAPFGALSNVQIIAEPSTVMVEDLPIDFLPYTRNPIEVVKDKFQNKSRVLCGHIAIADAELNRLYGRTAEVSVEIEKDMVKVSADILDGWERVFLGHYHGEQKLNKKVEYIGSPLQLSFGEAFQKKHIIVLDTDTLNVEYIENTFSPKHLVVPAEQVSLYDMSNNFVIVEVERMTSSSLVDMRKEIQEKYTNVSHLEFREVHRWEDQINPQELQKKFDLASGTDVLDRYIQAVGVNGLNTEKLREMGREICQGETA